MKKIIYYYSKNGVLLESLLTLMLFFIILVLCYFLFLQSTITVWRANQKQVAAIHNAYQKKRALKVDNANIVVQLKSWQHKHPQFYNAILAMHTSHNAMQLLTELIQNAQFSITHIVSDHKTKSTTIESTGKFSNLFLLFSELNHDPLPMIVSQLTITNPNKFTFKFILRGRHAQH
jgi:hypothetical protein